MSQKLNTPSCLTCGARHKSVFCSLNKNQLLDLDEHRGCEFYKKGEVIFKEGAYSKGLFCINKGKVKLSKLGNAGKEQIIRFSSEGDVMGYNAMLSQYPLSATATVIEDAAVCFIPANQFFDLIKSEPKFSMKVLETSAINWNQATKLITILAQKTAKQRLSEMLLWLKEMFGLDENDCIDVKLSREELANMIGTSTEASTRLLSDLRKEKLIASEGKKIKLIDIHGLIVLADLID